MNIVHLTVLGIAAATGLGAVLGERMGMLRGKWDRIMRGVGMLMTAVILLGILLPLWQEKQGIGLMLVLLGMICLLEWLGSRLERSGLQGSARRIRCIFLVTVIAVHHFPEGIAAGWSIAKDSAVPAVCAAVVLHSIPEAMVIVPTMREARFSRLWGYLAAGVSGLTEIAGVLVGAGI